MVNLAPEYFLLFLLESTVAIDIGFAWCCLGTLPTLLDIRLDVKVGEKEEEHSSVEKNNIAENFGEITFDEERQAGVEEKCCELCQLHCSQVPEIR